MYNQADLERVISEYQNLKDALGEMNKHRFADQYLTNEEFCSLLDISEKTAKRWRASQKIPFAQLGKRIYYRLSDIEALFEKQFELSAIMLKRKRTRSTKFVPDPQCNGWDLSA
jgi:hypothetical protein